MASTIGRVALITGGSQGIGRAVSKLLASKGYSIAVNFSSNKTMADSLISEVGNDKAISIQADAGSFSGIESMVDKTVSRFGKIDVLVCCAATLPMMELNQTTEEAFDKAMALNVKGPFFLTQKAAPHMQPKSHVVFISTNQCHNSSVTAPYALYTMTKGAVEQMVRVLAKDLGRKDINVNAIAPGPTTTNMFLNGKSPELLKTIASWSPRNRIGAPEEVAEAIAFLCEAQWVSGQTLKVNGAAA